jgi:hypothetical protein
LSSDPGTYACASAGLDWCLADVAGASFTDAWRIFSAWNEFPRLIPGLNRRLVAGVRELVVRTKPKPQRRR